MALYDNKSNQVNWREQHLYGSSRIGMWTPNVNLANNNAVAVWDTLGHKQYELSNHLGNVLATVSDIRISYSTNDLTTAYYLPDVTTAQDYYGFGGLMPGRTYTENSVYRYGFNGKENDNEVKGLGNQIDYGERIYDPRVGRWTTIDPLTAKYPSHTPYNFTFGNPIRFIDPDGLDTSLFDRTRGQLIATKPGGKKTAIYTVDRDAHDYNPKDPWFLAKSLRYQVGGKTKNKGITGKDFIDNSPLKNIGSKAGEQVFLEDLVDLTFEFNKIVDNGMNEFFALRGLSNDGDLFSDRAGAFRARDGIPSYAATVIGEWSILNHTLRRYDDYGNIAYGIFGLAAGFPQEQLIRGSNVNQQWKDFWGETHGSGDEPRDVEMIEAGFFNYQYFLKK